MDNLSFFALANLRGIACASDTDHTIQRLSKKEPLVIVINPNSPLPWESIVNGYVRRGEPVYRDSIREYAEDFEQYLKTVPVEPEWSDMPVDKKSIVLLGYGQNDLYPSIYKAWVILGDDGQLGLKPVSCSSLNVNDGASLTYIGNFDSLYAILEGCSPQVRKLILKEQMMAFEGYKQQILNAVKGTGHEQMALDFFDNYDPKKDFVENNRKASKNLINDVKIGIRSFNIEDMVTAAETLVNANVRLSYLRKGGNGLRGKVKEIAVLTRSEGVIWIMHSLFGI